MLSKLKFWEKRSESIELVEGASDDLVMLSDDGKIISKSANPEVFDAMIINGKGRIITRDSALALSAVYSCVDRISSAIAMMPILVKEKKGGSIKDVVNHDAAYLLQYRPNYWQTPFLLKQLLMSDVLLDGNMYCHIDRQRSGGINSIDYYDSRSVGLYNTGNKRWVYNMTDDEGNNIDAFPEDVIHVRALGNKGRKGLSPISLHCELIKMGLDAENYGQNFFGAGGKPSGIVSVNDNLGTQSMENLKTTWKNASRSADNSNKLIFLPANITYTATSISPIDAKLVEMMKLSRSEIGGIYNVPSYLIGDFDKAPNNNITQFSISFVRNTLQPWVTAIEEELNVKIFTTKELKSGLRCMFDMDILTRGTPTERAQINHYALTDGWKNRNTVRVEEGYERVEGQGLDDYVISVNAVAPSEKEDNNDSDDENKDKKKGKGLINGDNLMNQNGDDIEVKE